jgi:3-hydroxyisobutyrate dehydrogenase
MKTAVLGTGMMGSAMARTLLREGHEVTVWNRTAERARALEPNGARAADSSAEAVADADAVITMLFDKDAIERTADDFVPAMKAGAVWVQSSTVGPEAVRELARPAEVAGVAFLDGPVVGTKEPAEKGTLVCLVSGESQTIEAMAPVFDALGSKTVVVGDRIGDASALKLVCNAWVGTVTAATAQSLWMSSQLGVDPELFLRSIDGGPTNSPYMQLKGRMMQTGATEASFSVNGLAKDIGLMFEATGGRVGPVLGGVRDAFQRAIDEGHGQDDVATVRAAFD